MALELGPSSEFTSAARNQFFTELKPVCVEISRLALQGQQVPDRAKRTQELLTKLNGILEGQIQYNASILDEKIADYVFFPLSGLLRAHADYPIRLIETVIRSLRLLIQHGWRARISKDLSQQLLVFFTFIIGGVPGKEDSQPPKPEETILEAYKALTVLIKAAGVSAKDSPLTDAKIIPSLGHAVSVILDGVTDGITAEIQLEALQTIAAVYTTIKQDEVLATFFPGTASSLCRFLSPPSSTKSQRRVLVSGVNVLKIILTKVLGDLKRRNLLKQMENNGSQTEEAGQDEKAEGKVLTPSWLKATVSQVKIALSTVLKLRNHPSAEVRKATERLCIALLDECHSSLKNCTSMLVESAMILRENQEKETTAFEFPDIGEDHAMYYGTSLQDLATIYPELMDSIKTTLHNWITSMPRLMQSSDERVKQQAIRNIVKGQELAGALAVDSSSLHELLSSALRDSVVALILNSKTPKVLNEIDLDESLWRSSDPVQTGQELQSFSPVLLAQESQRDTRKDVMLLIDNIGSPTQQTKLAAEMLPYIRDSTGADQISSYWLSFQLLKSSFTKSADFDDLLDLTNAATESIPEDKEMVFDELYSFSVALLDSHSDAMDEVDWRLEAIALEVTSFAASRLGESFRPELIDVLYPISTFLGSSRPELRGHAITTLNSLAAFCGYGHVSDLIIDNVDYMVNSVSLRLNQFDISPASTKVLTMMIRLTGPRLLPFLDDVVAGIFAALDNYHGYTNFVESLFGVLSEIVEQGVKSGPMLIEEGQTKAVNHKKRPLESSGLEDTLTYLNKRAKRRIELEEEDDVEEVIRSHPQEAWKSSAKEELDAIEARNNGQNEPDEPPASNEEVAISPTSTYVLLTKITSLTQHYLTSPTPTLRRRLLDLLSKVSAALAQDENAFLPLVNDVWPVVISRLHDAEPYVVIAACDTLAALCKSAGDFLSSRVKTEWWESLSKWCTKVRDEARKTKAGGSVLAKSRPGLLGTSVGEPGRATSDGILLPVRGVDNLEALQLESASTHSISNTTGLGRFASSAQTWDAVVSMLIAVISYVRVEDSIFEDILQLLADDVLPRNVEAREALEAVNADAVWLVMYERGYIEPLPTPVMEGVEFAAMKKPEV